MSGREGPCGALGKGIHRSSGPTVIVGGAALACPVTSDLVGRQVCAAA
jgi:hypothetical protein